MKEHYKCFWKMVFATLYVKYFKRYRHLSHVMLSEMTTWFENQTSSSSKCIRPRWLKLGVK